MDGFTVRCKVIPFSLVIPTEPGNLKEKSNLKFNKSNSGQCYAKRFKTIDIYNIEAVYFIKIAIYFRKLMTELPNC